MPEPRSVTPEQAREAGYVQSRTLCPECGPGVAVDEDGLCSLCGATATGPWCERACAALRAAAAAAQPDPEADVEAARDDAYWVARFLVWRGVEDPCPMCHGSGARLYSSTATWRGGIGGAALRTDVCDTCWGTGDAQRKGVDLRAALSQPRPTPDADGCCRSCGHPLTGAEAGITTTRPTPEQIRRGHGALRYLLHVERKPELDAAAEADLLAILPPLPASGEAKEE